MKDSRGVLVKVVLFQSRMKPRPIVLLILNTLYKGFQIRYHLFKTFFGKMVEIKETSFLISKCLVSIAHHCILSAKNLKF